MVQGSDRWITRPRPRSQAPMRLFCIPYAGGGVAAYRGWIDKLPAELDICLVRLPGRESRLNEKPFSRLGPLLGALQAAIRPWLDRPFALFGHSMGALLAFELVYALLETSSPLPEHLYLSGYRAPHLPFERDPIHALPSDEFRQRLRDLNGTPDEVLGNPELMEFFEPLLRADFAVGENYQYHPRRPLPCPVTAFGGLGDDRAGASELEPWRELTTGPFSLEMLPGDHFFLHSSRDLLLATLSRSLEQHLSQLRSRQE